MKKRVRLAKIKVDELKKYITLGFADDPELINTIHISPGTLEHCVNHTFESVKSGEEFYRVEYNNQPIGFVVVVRNPKNFVPSFGININFRKKEILLKFLGALASVFHHERYIIGVWEKNERAIGFFRKNNFNISVVDKMAFLWV